MKLFRSEIYLVEFKPQGRREWIHTEGKSEIYLVEFKP